MTAQTRKNAILPGVGLGIIVADQITKWVILTQVGLYQNIPVIPGFFNLTRVHNPGGAFGFLAGQTHDIRTFLFILVSFLATGFIVYLYFKTPASLVWLLTGLALIFGGAAGNLIDRLRFGAVVDFLDFYLGSLHWPAFNVADSAICVGMAVVIYYIIFKKVPF